MDIKQYIGTGILEDYVLGMVSEQEMREVQCLSKIYPEISSYLSQIEDELAEAVLVDAVAPPKDLKSKILENLPERSEEDEVREMPQPVLSIVKDEEEVEAEQAPNNESKRSFPWAIAASFVIIVGLGGMYFQSNSKIGNMNDEIQSLVVEAGLQQESIEQLRRENRVIASDLAFVTSLDTKTIGLASAKEGFEATAQVYWNPETSEVLFETSHMPQVASGKQYQLWTIVEGAPVSQGVIPLKDELGLSKMQATTGEPVAFAISLEPEGGSETPTEVLMVGAIES